MIYSEQFAVALHRICGVSWLPERRDRDDSIFLQTACTFKANISYEFTRDLHKQLVQRHNLM